MYALIYVSSAVRRLTDDDLELLLRESRENNVRVGITGLLLYKDGNFMQLLEGTKEAVLAIMEKIKKDPRHQGVKVVLEEEKQNRDFSGWSMGFQKLGPGTAQEIPGYSDFLDLPLTSREFTAPSTSLRFLLIFKKSVL
jgi:hypothetical protein